jgi:hypothetical protein
MAHTIVMVPEGHTVQVHPPGHIPQPALQPGTAGHIPDPAHDGALAAMNAALPVPGEKTMNAAEPQQPARKKKSAAKSGGKAQDRNEGSAGKEKTPR